MSYLNCESIKYLILILLSITIKWDAYTYPQYSVSVLFEINYALCLLYFIEYKCDTPW